MADPSDDAYNDRVRDHFAAPRNTPCHDRGPGVVFGEAGSESEGVRYRLSARLQGRCMTELRFEAYGCPYAIAAASRLTEQLTGCAVEEAEHWNWRSLAAELALPAEKRGRLLVLEDALRSLMRAARSY